MKVREIATPEPKRIRPDATLAEAASGMKTLDIGFMPVFDGERLVGILTDRDIVTRAVAGGCDPKTTLVGDVMSRATHCCFEDQDIKDAAQIMERSRIRRLPVLDRKEQLVGILSLGDLAARARDVELAGKVLTRVSAPAYSS